MNIMRSLSNFIENYALLTIVLLRLALWWRTIRRQRLFWRQGHGVQVSSGSFVYSLQMVLQLPGGQITYMDKHGGDGGNAATFSLRDGEYINAISGSYGQYVDSIRFHTNLRVSPTYGGNGGDADYYYAAPPGWQIVGLYGRSGAYIDAVGVVLAEQ